MRILKNNVDEYTNDKEKLIGKKIRIINMDDPYDGKRYNGREGIIELVMTDPTGEICYAGTWGGLNVYPNIDEIEFIEESLDEATDTPEDNIEVSQIEFGDLSEDEIDIHRDSGEVEYALPLWITFSNNDTLYLAAHLNIEFNYHWEGEYIRASRWDPAEYPELVIELSELTKKDIDLDYYDFEYETELEDTEVLEDAYAKAKDKIMDFIVQNQKKFYKRIYDTMYESPEDFSEPEPDYDPYDYID